MRTAVERRQQRTRAQARFVAKVVGLVGSMAHRGAATSAKLLGLLQALQAPAGSEVPTTRLVQVRFRHEGHAAETGGNEMAPDPAAAPADTVGSLEGFLVGSKVMIQGLVGRSDLNGRPAIVLDAREEGSTRVPVLVTPLSIGGKMVKKSERICVRPQCIRLATDFEKGLFDFG